MAHFQAQAPTGARSSNWRVLVRTAIFKSANELVGWLLQQAADRIDAAYQPKPGEVRKGRETIGVAGHFRPLPFGPRLLLPRRQEPGPLSGR